MNFPVSLHLLISGLIFFVGHSYFLYINLNNKIEAAFLGFLWLLFFYFGATLSYWFSFINSDKANIKKRDWYSGQLLSSLFLIIISSLILDGFRSLKYHPILLITVLISYFFAKISCIKAGCCGKNKLSTSIQKAEAVSVLVLALMTFLIQNINPIIIIGLFGFMRITSYLFQDKLIFKIRLLFYKSISEIVFTINIYILYS